MRARFLQALAQPLEDIEAAGRKLDRFRRPIVIVRAVGAKVDMAERALETLSLGLALAEVLTNANDDEGES